MQYENEQTTVILTYELIALLSSVVSAVTQAREGEYGPWTGGSLSKCHCVSGDEVPLLSNAQIRLSLLPLIQTLILALLSFDTLRNALCDHRQLILLVTNFEYFWYPHIAILQSGVQVSVWVSRDQCRELYIITQEKNRHFRNAGNYILSHNRKIVTSALSSLMQ